MMTTSSEKANSALRSARKMLTRTEFKALTEYLIDRKSELTSEAELIYRIESVTAQTIAWRGCE